MLKKMCIRDRITGGKGVVFATGTPISNSMTEMYTIQRYLQYNTLKEHGLEPVSYTHLLFLDSPFLLNNHVERTKKHGNFNIETGQ